MHLKKIYLLIFIITALFSDARIKYLQKDADIEFIGKRNGYERITVPKEIVEYEPTLRYIENTILYTEREIRKATCIIDHLDHEYCPIDKTECNDERDYVNGTSKKTHQIKKVDPFCAGVDIEVLKQNDAGITYLECFKDSDQNGVKDRATRSIPSIGSFTAVDTVEGEGFWDTSIRPGFVVQRKNPNSPTFFVYSPTSVERDNMIIEGDLSVDTSLAIEYPGDNDWIGFVFGYQDTKNYYFLSWRRNSTIGKTGGNLWTGFTLGKVTNGTLPWNHGTGKGNVLLQRNTNSDIYGWENGGKYKVKIVYNKFFIKAYIAKYDSVGNVGAYNEVINYNPEEEMNITGKMGFMNHSNGGAVYGGFKADYCPIGYAVDGDTYQCKREPDCENYYQKIRWGDVGVIRCEMEYDYYDYLCPDEPNIYGNNYIPLDPGGDCGHVLCTNDSTPPINNCVRLKHSCPVDPSKTCVLEEKQMDYNDFTKWSVMNYGGRVSADCPNYSGISWWVVDEEMKNSVFQKCNGYPTYFLSNYELNGGHITMQGTFKTDDPKDNDWFGFVFGLKDSENYYILDWSRWRNDNWRSNHDADGNPTGGAIPLTLAKATNLSSRGPLWSHVDNGSSYKVLQRKDNGGWTTGIEYDIKIDITEHDIKVWIGQSGGPMTLDIDYHSDTPLDISGKLGFYNYSISRVTYKNFRIEWTDQDIEHTHKRPLAVPTVEGEYKGLEFGVLKGYECEDGCRFSLSKMYAKDEHTLCLVDRQGSEGCMNFSEDCTLEGKIEETLPYNDALFSFLNDPGEDVPAFNGYIVQEAGDSPTGISLKFSSNARSAYPLGDLDHPVTEGDKRTVDFWMKWDGEGKGSVFSFGDYGLWMSTAADGKDVFGFNDEEGNIWGIQADSMAGGWHRITAVFTQGSVQPNKLYIDGVEQSLSRYIIIGFGSINGEYAYTSVKPRDDHKIGAWGVNEFFPIDTSVTYTLGATLEISNHQGDAYGSNDPLQYFGISNFDSDYNRITPYNYMRYAGATDTRFSRDLNPGDTKMYVLDASGWDNGPGMWYRGVQHSHSFIWYGYTNSDGYTYPDYYYTRYRSGSGAWPEGGIRDLGGEWEITLKQGWWGNKITAGTAVRNNRGGLSDTWALFAAESLRDGVYPRTNTFGGGVNAPEETSLYKFMPGVAYIKPVLLANYFRYQDAESAPAPTVTVRDIYMKGSESGSISVKNPTSNMMQPMYLSGAGLGADGMFTGSVAGINIFAGELSQDTITRMHNSGSFNGITYLKVNQNSIEGFDAGGAALGKIESSCKLSGKVGDFGQTVEVAETVEHTRESKAYDLTAGSDYLSIPNSNNIDMVGKTQMAVYMNVRLDDTPTTNYDILYNKEGQYELSVDNNRIIKFALYTENKDWVWISTGLSLPLGEFKNILFSYDGSNVTVKVDDKSWSMAYSGAIKVTNSNVRNEPLRIGDRYYAQGSYTPDITVADFKIWSKGLNATESTMALNGELVTSGLIAHYDFEGSNPNKDKYGGEGDVSVHGAATLVTIGTFTESEVVFKEKIISYPIVAARATNNRIEFWDSFTRGPIGFIEPLKYVKDVDYGEGYRHEFTDLDKLYGLGFTSFVTSEANITYAISNEEMDTASCLAHIRGTQYFLSDRDLNDEVEMSTLRALTPYLNGEFGEFCVIEKNGAYSNPQAEFAIKKIVKKGVYTTFVCSPWSCESHNCGVASCKEHFTGTVIKPKDRDLVLNSTICLKQRCDINNDYFSVCGNKTGCPDTPGIYQQEDNRCVQAECDSGDTLNTQSGMCEKLGCKNSIDAGDGTCYKKL